MWGKTNDSNTKPAAASPFSLGSQSAANPEQERAMMGPPPVRQPVRQSSASIGKSTKLHGQLYSEEELYLDGEVEGTIEVRNRLTIGPNGKVKASVKAKELVVSGSIHGNVEATDRISIMTGASIVGDVKTAGIVIEDGAYFKGGIDILRPEVTKKPETAAPVLKAQGAA
jgi:cytoskeletal protein CcmA (bactofilin family)